MEIIHTEISNVHILLKLQYLFSEKFNDGTFFVFVLDTGLLTLFLYSIFLLFYQIFHTFSYHTKNFDVSLYFLNINGRYMQFLLPFEFQKIIKFTIFIQF